MRPRPRSKAPGAYGAEIVSYDRVRDDREAIAATHLRGARRHPDQAL